MNMLMKFGLTYLLCTPLFQPVLFPTMDSDLIEKLILICGGESQDMWGMCL